MTVPDDLAGMLDRIAQGRETESDRRLLQQLLRQERGTVQLGKYNVNLGEGREIQVGDRIYQGADADTLKALLQAVLQQSSVPRSPLTPQEYRNRQTLLSKVKNFWLKGVLETSLHHQVAMQLGLEDRSNLLVTPWSLGLEDTDQAQPCLPENTTVVDLFDQLGDRAHIADFRRARGR